MSSEFQVTGKNAKALFTLKIHRGDGMALIAMNWKKGKPPKEFVGFAIEYKEPGGVQFFALKNRLTFPGADGAVNPKPLSTLLSPIQKFRWVHFPRSAEMDGDFVYRISPVFMNAADELSYGEGQQAAIELRRETHPGKLNVTFTRGFVSSQAFVDKFGKDANGKDALPTLLPKKAEEGLDFVPTHPKADEALAWMGFEARSAILEVLDQAIADPTAEVRAAVYDLNEPEVVKRLATLGPRLRILIDDDGAHGKKTSSESKAAARLIQSTKSTPADEHVRRQHLGKLQHNKFIVVNGSKVQAAVCGSTNHSWRGFYVQNNNAIILRGKEPVRLFQAAFADYWKALNSVTAFNKSGSAKWNKLGLPGIDVRISFSPRTKSDGVLTDIAGDIAKNTTSSLFFSLAFLYQTKGALQNAVKKIQSDDKVFSYGISDHRIPGLENGLPKSAGVDVKKPGSSKVTIVHSEALQKNVPQPFKAEPTGGGGTRMHHKFVVIDFNEPTARVYIGSYNFSLAADNSNGENLLLIKDRRIAVAYTVEAVRLFDHYHFRVVQAEARKARKVLQLARPPRKPGEKAWWAEDYAHPRKILDRELFA